jgi:hypothetical protein
MPGDQMGMIRVTESRPSDGTATSTTKVLLDESGIRMVYESGRRVACPPAAEAAMIDVRSAWRRIVIDIVVILMRL